MGDSWLIPTLAMEGASHALKDAFGNGTAQDPDTHKNETVLQSGTMLLFGLLPAITMMAMIVTSFLLGYVLDELVFSLASIEIAMPGGVESEKFGLLDSAQAFSKRSDEQMDAVPKARFVSSGVRSILRHLQSEAGDLSMFRGIGAQVMLQSLHQILLIIGEFVLKYPLRLVRAGRFVPAVSLVLSRLLLAQADAAWFHIVISKPRHKFWYRRLPLTFFTMVQTLWIPIVAIALATESFDWVQSKIESSFIDNGRHDADVTLTISDGPVVSIGLFTILWAIVKMFLKEAIRPLVDILLIMPLQVVRNRMIASTLPDKDDPIIPMERHHQPLDFISACRSFDKPTYTRLARLTIKCFLIGLIIIWAFMALMTAEVFALIGFSGTWVVLKMLFQIPVRFQDFDGVSNSTRAILYKVMNNNEIPGLSNGTMANVTVSVVSPLSTASAFSTTM